MLVLTAARRANLPCGLRVHGNDSLAAGYSLSPFVPELSHANSHGPKAEHPHTSTATWLHSTSLIQCDCTIWHLAEGHPGPSATSSGGKHLLGRRVQVGRAVGDAGRRVGAVWLYAAPCRAPWHAASSLQELKGDCSVERRRKN